MASAAPNKMPLLPVDDALAMILAGIAKPTESETVPLAALLGRTLSAPVTALRTQPPFRASAMDGYAVRAADVASVPAQLALIGTSAAGHAFVGGLEAGQTVRIFTGAPVPDGADAVVLQEDARAEGDVVTILESVAAGRHIRAAGLDFKTGETLLEAGRRLDPRAVGLAASLGHPALSVRKKPRIGILATGDELVQPGETPRADQIVVSNTYAVAALVERAGGEPVDLGIALDTFAALEEAIGRARAAQIDVLVTIGGASVGEHDLVQSALASEGMVLGFWRIAMRPGKPLLHGHIGKTAILGLPGNPVSSYVCALLFLVPLVRALLGDPDARRDPSQPAVLGKPMAANDGRQDYVRARLEAGRDGLPVAIPFDRQDSSMTRTLADADALIIRAAHAPQAEAGELCPIIKLG